MRILLVSQYFWPESFRINEVALSLRDAGCELTVLTGQPNYPHGSVASGYRAMSTMVQAHEGMTIIRVPLAPRGQASAIRLALNYVSFVVSGLFIAPWLLRGRRFDAIFVYAPSPITQAIPAIWLSRLKGTPVATWVQDLWPESLAITGFVKNKRLLAGVAAMVRWIYRHNDLLLVQSRAFVAPVRAMSEPAVPVTYHPNPGDRRADVAPREGAPPALQLDDGFNVLFGGNLGTVQALDTVLDAAQLLKQYADVRIVLVGSGSRSDWLQQEIARLDLHNVQLPGRFDPREMPGILSQASALLVSLARDDTLARTVPAKLQSYLAAGRPIIASLDGEGAHILVEAGAGIACPAQDAQALASAVLQLRSMDAEERAQMGQRGRAYYEREFEPGALAEKLVRELASMSDRCKVHGSDS